MHLSITKELDGMRLDVALVSLLGVTRSEIQKRLSKGNVHVNGKVGKKNTRMYEGDTVVIEIEDKNVQEPLPIIVPKILHTDTECIVICKPRGLVVHPAPQHPSGTLVDFLLEHYPEMAKVGDDPQRPGIVHRLDKDASGVMVIARNQDSFDSLKRQFKIHTVKKEYYAVAYGVPLPLEGTISLLLGRRNSSPKIVASTQKGRKAITHYWVEKQAKFCSLVRIVTETGRTHQIRAHLYAVGNPLVGDTVYKSKKIKPIIVSRLMLHAYQLTFTDLTGKKQAFSCDIPEEFEEVLTKY
ncbi:MAG: RluA family pseudouridine synthase [Patescibacteria group bacterium]